VQSPDAPQWFPSLFGSTQVPPQATSFAGQVVAQIPAAQTWPEPQAAPAFAPVQSPEAPQWSWSVCGETQVSCPGSPHDTCPAGQVVAQAPPAQTCPAVQATPADGPAQPATAPQWKRSVSGSTHCPAQASWPTGHEPAHSPPEHTPPLQSASE
jgi:hypothetical protein